MISHRSKRNGFPFVIPNAASVGYATGNGTYYPVGLTLPEAMDFYWRVKDLAFSGSFSISNVTSNYSDLDGNGGRWPELQQEASLCLGNVGHVYAQGYFGPAVPSKQFVAFTTDVDSFPTYVDPPQYADASRPEYQMLSNGSLYYPLIYTRLRYDYAQSFNIGSWPNGVGGSMTDSGVVFRIYGKDFTAYGNNGISGGPLIVDFPASNGYYTYGGAIDPDTGVYIT